METPGSRILIARTDAEDGPARAGERTSPTRTSSWSRASSSPTCRRSRCTAAPCTPSRCRPRTPRRPARTSPWSPTRPTTGRDPGPPVQRHQLALPGRRHRAAGRALRRSARSRLLLAGCAARGAVPPLAPEVAALAAELDSALAEPAFDRALWGVVVESLDNGQVLYRRDAERLFVPASNLKLMTTAAALARLGPDFRWTTTVLARGARHGDTLVGDLVVVGRGDPTFAVDATGDSVDELHALRPWADSLTARGIRVVRGRVTGDASRSPIRRWAAAGRGTTSTPTTPPRSARSSSTRRVAWIEVEPGIVTGAAVGLPCCRAARRCAIFGTVATAPADSTSSPPDWSRAPFGDSVSGRAACSAGHAPVRLPVSVPDPTRYFDGGADRDARRERHRGPGRHRGRADRGGRDAVRLAVAAPLGRAAAVPQAQPEPDRGDAAADAGRRGRGVGTVDSGRAVVQSRAHRLRRAAGRVRPRGRLRPVALRLRRPGGARAGARRAVRTAGLPGPVHGPARRRRGRHAGVADQGHRRRGERARQDRLPDRRARPSPATSRTPTASTCCSCCW